MLPQTRIFPELRMGFVVYRFACTRRDWDFGPFRQVIFIALSDSGQWKADHHLDQDTTISTEVEMNPSG